MYSNNPAVRTRYRDFAIRVREAAREAERAQAALARVFAEAADYGMEEIAELNSPSSREAELPMRALAAELGAAANMSDRTVQRRMNDALTLAERFPATFDAWEDCRVSTGHVRIIMENGLPITDPDARASFEAEALVRAEETTPGRLGSSLARLAESDNSWWPDRRSVQAGSYSLSTKGGCYEDRLNRASEKTRRFL